MDRRQLFSLAPLAGSLVAGGLIALTASETAQASEGGGGAPKAAYNSLGTLTATIIRPDGRRGVMTAEVGLDVPDAALNAEVALQGPRLRAAFNTVLQGIAEATLPGTPPDVDRLHHELQVATIRTLKKQGAAVLLGTVMVI
jgi:flagellar basal body-associated protein FliL